MFVSMIQSFLKLGSILLDEKVLNLELLAYNFHGSLNLKPLFLYIDRQIRTPKDTLGNVVQNLMRSNVELERQREE